MRYRILIDKRLNALGEAERLFGYSSVAAYVQRCNLIATLITELLQVNFQNSLLEEVLRRETRALQHQFELMTPRKNYNNPAFFNMRIKDGFPCYTSIQIQLGDQEDLEADFLQEKIIELDRQSFGKLLSFKFYLYCIDSKGIPFIFLDPLSTEEFLNGCYREGRPVTHGHLSAKKRREVRCAGHLMRITAPFISSEGLLVTRASGHFRPGPESRRSIFIMAKEKIGISNLKAVIVT